MLPPILSFGDWAKNRRQDVGATSGCPARWEALAAIVVCFNIFVEAL